jgi:predicted regulator of Ras-like GTPase activity (Roadblock/LC7/MglB family)
MELSDRANEAIADLLDVSPQVETVVIARRDGQVVGHSLHERPAAATAFAAACRDILEQAETARLELDREPVTQCEIATGHAHVFVVADAERYVGAVTPVDPTVGLVFYDLKTALRTLRESGGSSLVTETPAATSTPAAENGTDAEGSASDNGSKKRFGRRSKGAGT